MNSKKKLSTIGLYSYILGTVMGAGMFITLPAAIGFTGKSTVLSVIVAGIAAFLGFFFTLVVSSFVSIRGGAYGAMAFNSPVALPGICGMVTLIWCISNNTYAAGAIEYLSELAPWLGVHMKTSVIGLLILFMLIDYFGLEIGEKVQSFLTITLVVSLGMFIVFGLAKGDYSILTDSSIPFFANGSTGFFKSIGMSIWVVSGVGLAAVNFAPVVKNPTRTIPKAIILGNVIVIVIGVLLAVVCVINVPMGVAAQGLNAVAAQILPRPLFWLLVIGGATFALLSSLLGYTLGYRVSMIEYAADGFLPKFFLKRTKSGYPWVIGLTIFGLSVVPYIFNMDLDDVVAYCEAPMYLLILFVNISCANLPKKYPDLWKKSMLHMPMPLWYCCIGLSVLGAGYVVYCFCCDYSAKQLLAIAAVIVFMLSYIGWRVKSGKVNLQKYEDKRNSIIRESLAAENEN